VAQAVAVDLTVMVVVVVEQEDIVMFQVKLSVLPGTPSLSVAVVQGLVVIPPQEVTEAHHQD
jgi:hypothetical protein